MSLLSYNFVLTVLTELEKQQILIYYFYLPLLNYSLIILGYFLEAIAINHRVLSQVGQISSYDSFKKSKLGHLSTSSRSIPNQRSFHLAQPSSTKLASLHNVNFKRHLLINVQIRVTHAPHTQLMVTRHRHSEVHFDLLGLVSHSRLLDSIELSGL